jgi:hypothetical protein
MTDEEIDKAKNGAYLYFEDVRDEVYILQKTKKYYTHNHYDEFYEYKCISLSKLSKKKYIDNWHHFWNFNTEIQKFSLVPNKDLKRFEHIKILNDMK